MAETGFSASSPVHISTLSHSLYLTHALDFPCAPGLGQIHGITGFLNVEANWNYRKKQEIQNIPHVFLPPPNHSCICFSNSVCSQSSTVNRTANESQDNALIHV